MNLKTSKHYINLTIWALAALYLGIAILVNLPAVQGYIGQRVASALAEKLHTRVSVGRVDLGLFNRIIIDDVRLDDQRQKPMLRASRLSAKLDLIELAQGRISVTSAQLFGLDARLYQADAHAKPNFQFVLDSLASRDTTQRKPLFVELKSLIIRHGAIRFDRLDQPRRATLDPHHLHVSRLSSHIILNTLRDDSLNLHIKRLSLAESSGLDLRGLSFHLVANRQGATLSQLEVRLPRSVVRADRLSATYRLRRKELIAGSLRYEGSLAESTLYPADLAFIVPRLGRIARPLVVSASATGTDHSLTLHRLQASMPRPHAAVTLGAPSDIRIDLGGSLTRLGQHPRWQARISQLMIDDAGLKLLAGDIPAEVSRLRHLSYRGTAAGDADVISTRGTLRSGAGNAEIQARMQGRRFAGHVSTQGFNLRQLLADDQFGQLATDIHLAGDMARRSYQARGTVSRLDYHGYSYRNIRLDGQLVRSALTGRLHVDDPNFRAVVDGSLDTGTQHPGAHLTASLRHLNPAQLHLASGRQAHAAYSAEITAHFRGRSINTAQGHLAVTRFSREGAAGRYSLDSLVVRAGNDRRGHFLSLRSDIAEADVTGRFDYATIVQSVKNVIASKLPSIQYLTPIRYRRTQAGDFSITAVIRRSDWLREFLGMPVQFSEPVHISGGMDREAEALRAQVYAPSFSYDGASYRDLTLSVTSPGSTLAADLSLTRLNAKGRPMEYRIEASADNDRLLSAISVDNHASRRLRGELHSVTQFARNGQGQAEARVSITPSTLSVGDSVFHIQPSLITYSRNRLHVDHFAVTGGGQHVRVSGTTAKGTPDSLTIDLNRVNVSYILDLVNFHSVDFSGYASGRAYLSRLFDKPAGHGQLEVDDFRFEDGRMGTLAAQVAWNPAQEQIDIDAVAADTLLAGGTAQPRTTLIRGYVSPSRHYIDLGIHADRTRCDFLQSFCRSFMSHTDITADGDLRLWGDLSSLNLTGQLVANGTMGISSLNTEYTLHNDTITSLVNEIQFRSCRITDRDGHQGIVTGSLYHDHLSRLRYDIRAQADHLLAYDWGPTYGSTFYGTVYGTGTVGIKGRPGEVNIDVDLTPERGSQVVYDVSSPDAIGGREFIHWTSRDSLHAAAATADITDAQADHTAQAPAAPDIPTDIRINFLINTTPDATLKLIMDKATGDYITLNGSGGIRAAYYNKGALNIFGNYLIDHGLYKLTIQNVVKRVFEFTPGGTIVFGGNPYAASLNLMARYVLNSVSLSDLQIGRSFSSNNIRVNCIMNITGTPRSPRVAFDLDLPTVSNDAKQMIYSLINSEEEMNQQVLYLLAVGRFYSQGSNNATAGAGDSQTSLAMQSILSGQISQQLNSVLSTVIKNTNWNFGANISTGDEGWNNAEYEGLLSGRMLGNRLLFNGQFGYRDNTRATTSFIGDFDLLYLIFPNGNLSVHVYNQTNDRYFTRNSLNTQGIGFILKKDFSSWRSLFGRRKKKAAGTPADTTTVTPPAAAGQKRSR